MGRLETNLAKPSTKPFERQRVVSQHARRELWRVCKNTDVPINA